MASRRLPEEPISRFAIWAQRMALFSLPVVLMAIIIVRSGFLEIIPALATFGGALILAVIAILLSFCAFVVIWREGLRGLGKAVMALFIGLAILAYPAYLGIRSLKLPEIYDITTDPIDPPRFEMIARVRPRDANPVLYAGLRAAELQRTAYPNVEPLLLGATPQVAFDAALAVVTKRRWQIIYERGPLPGGRREGRIEAVARTPIMGFRDDVVIRVRADPDGSRIDMRSASRYGRFDFGTNAARIRSLHDDIEANVSDLTPEVAPEPPKKGKTKAPLPKDQKKK